LTGSANYTIAAGWARQQFRQLGLAHVSGEDWLLPSTWEPVAGVKGEILTPVSHELHIHAQGWSPSTPVGGIEGAVVHVKSMSVADLDQQKSELVGAIALVDEDSLRNTGGFEKSLAADQRLQTLGVKGILVPGGLNGIEDMGVMAPYGMIGPVPEAEIGREDVLLIRRLQAHGPVSARFSFTNITRSNVQVPNIIAEISGRELPDEVVIVNAHLDSWQPGTGAQDDGTGVAMLLETARAIMQLHRAPRRTIRF
jgi:carboxypeptidase Q